MYVCQTIIHYRNNIYFAFSYEQIKEFEMLSGYFKSLCEMSNERRLEQINLWN